MQISRKNIQNLPVNMVLFENDTNLNMSFHASSLGNVLNKFQFRTIPSTTIYGTLCCLI